MATNVKNQNWNWKSYRWKKMVIRKFIHNCCFFFVIFYFFLSSDGTWRLTKIKCWQDFMKKIRTVSFTSEGQFIFFVSFQFPQISTRNKLSENKTKKVSSRKVKWETIFFCPTQVAITGASVSSNPVSYKRVTNFSWKHQQKCAKRDFYFLHDSLHEMRSS